MKSIVKKISVALIVLAMVAGAFVGLAKPAAATELGYVNGANFENARGNGQQTNLFGNGGTITTVINIMLFVIGIACVIMIIYGGIRYTISRGNPDDVKNAKNTILYAIVGLVIAIIAYAIVNWVIGALATNS